MAMVDDEVFGVPCLSILGPQGLYKAELRRMTVLPIAQTTN